MQALASSRGVRFAPLGATSQPQPKQQRGRVVAAKVARSTSTIASRTNAVVVSSARRPPPPRAAFVVVAAAAASSNNVPLVTRDEGPISEEAFSVR